MIRIGTTIMMVCMAAGLLTQGIEIGSMRDNHRLLVYHHNDLVQQIKRERRLMQAEQARMEILLGYNVGLGNIKEVPKK